MKAFVACTTKAVRSARNSTRLIHPACINCFTNAITVRVEAAMNAIPRVKDKGQFARPEARILDSLRTALFDHIPAPVDPSVLTAQQGAFEIDGELGFKLPGELGYEDDGEDEVGEGEE